MNKVFMAGRLTKDPEVKHKDDMTIATFFLAVDKQWKKGEADFFNCVAFRKTADFVEKYFKKGMLVLVFGRLENSEYQNKNGDKVRYTQVVVEEVQFGESKKASADNADTHAEPQAAPSDDDGFMRVPDNVSDAGLPFN